MATTPKKGQAYRLDWQGQAKDIKDVNVKSSGLWIKTDEMIQTLFRRLKDAEAEIATLEEEIASLQTLNGGSGGGTTLIQYFDESDNDPVWPVAVAGAAVSAATPVTPSQIRDAGYWSPWVEDDGPGNAEFILTDGGDTIAVWTPTS